MFAGMLWASLGSDAHSKAVQNPMRFSETALIADSTHVLKERTLHTDVLFGLVKDVRSPGEQTLRAQHIRFPSML